MKIFISWSKAKSMELAIKTKELLESLDPQIEAFVSQVDIHAGEDVQNKIIEKIRACDKLVLCFTKENKKSPWLLFEAGYARGINKVVVPLLFDVDPNWHSWIDNPMNIAREISFNHNNFIDSFLTGFNISNTKSNRLKIEKYIKSITEIKEKFREVDIECEDFVGKLVHNDAFVVENPFFQKRVAHFLSGFESFDLYKAIIESFMYTGKYLWIYGRKNMKLFSGSFSNFFRYLEELNACILRAKAVIKDNKQLEKCFRYYSNRREEIIIRLDNCIIYSRPIFDAHGKPQLLTNTGFEVFSVNSPKGQECIEKYEEIWNNARLF